MITLHLHLIILIRFHFTKFFLPASQYFFASFTFGFTISRLQHGNLLSGPLMKLSGINPVAGLEPLFNNVSTNGLRSKASEIALRIFLFAKAGSFDLNEGRIQMYLLLFGNLVFLYIYQ